MSLVQAHHDPPSLAEGDSLLGQDARSDIEAQLRAIRRVHAVIEFRPDGTILNCNQTFLEAMGYRRQEVIGRHHRMFMGPDEVDSEAYRQHWVDLASGKPHAGVFCRRTKGGQDIWLQATYVPIWGEDEQVVKVVKYATDVTQRKKAEIAVQHTAQKLGESALEVLGMGHALREQAELTAEQSVTVVAVAERVDGNVQQAADAAWGLKESIEAIEKASSQARQAAQRGVDSSIHTREVIGQLGSSSVEVEGVLKVIASIAAQTNLLALNATIEAARAGAAGKGFAVVANEVKELAKETRKATEDIGRRIGAMQSDAVASADAIATISRVIEDIARHQDGISAAVTEQAQATARITEAINEAAISSAQVAYNVEEVGSSAESVKSLAEQGEQVSANLTGLAEQLSTHVASFS